MFITDPTDPHRAYAIEFIDGISTVINANGEFEAVSTITCNIFEQITKRSGRKSRGVIACQRVFCGARDTYNWERGATLAFDAAVIEAFSRPEKELRGYLRLIFSIAMEARELEKQRLASIADDVLRKYGYVSSSPTNSGQPDVVTSSEKRVEQREVTAEEAI
jgi:hypothetical protein